MRPIGQKPRCLVAFRHIFGFSLPFKPKTRLLAAFPSVHSDFHHFGRFCLCLPSFWLFCGFFAYSKAFYGFSPLFGAFQPICRLLTPFLAIFKLFARFCDRLQQTLPLPPPFVLFTANHGCLEDFRLLTAVCLHFGLHLFILRLCTGRRLVLRRFPLYSLHLGRILHTTRLLSLSESF